MILNTKPRIFYFSYLHHHKSVYVEVETCSNATDHAGSFNSLLASIPNSNNDVPSEQIDSTNTPVVITSDDCIEDFDVKSEILNYLSF